MIEKEEINENIHNKDVKDINNKNILYNLWFSSTIFLIASIYSPPYTSYASVATKKASLSIAFIPSLNL